MKPGDMVWIPAIIADKPLEGYEHVTNTTWVVGGTSNPFGNDTDMTLPHHPALPAVARVLVENGDDLLKALVYAKEKLWLLRGTGLPSLNDLIAALSQEDHDGR